MVKRAIAHEHFIEYGGGEYVASELARMFDAEVFSGAVETEEVPQDIDVKSVVNGKIGNYLTRLGAAPRDLYYLLRWPSVDLTDYDTIIQSGNNPGWYVPEDDQTIVKYVHSTPRGPYDMYHEYDGGVLDTVFNHAVRTLYQQTVPYPDLFIANSEVIARRLQRYWDVREGKIEVIYPPVSMNQYGYDAVPTADYYFTWSRLYGHKNIDQIIHAFNHLGDEFPLIVGGDGPEKTTLENLADDHITFTGWMSETEKAELASGAKAVVFAATNEDFGLVPIEAMASGTPVIGINDGFTQHQIIDGKNGHLFPKVQDLEYAIRGRVADFESRGVEWSEDVISAFARENFGRPRFRKKMRKAVKRAERESEITVNLETPQIHEPTVQ